MLRLITFPFIAVLVLSLNDVALSFFDAEVLVGKRWYEWSNDGVTAGIASQEITVAAHVDPIPLIPVAFGLSYSLYDWSENDISFNSTSGGELDLEVKAWLPMVPIVTPYAKLRYTLLGTLEGSGTSDAFGKLEAEYKITGYHINLGAKYSIIPLVSILFEYGLGMQQIKAEKITFGGVDQPKGDTSDLNSNSFFVGVEVGF